MTAAAASTIASEARRLEIFAGIAAGLVGLALLAQFLLPPLMAASSDLGAQEPLRVIGENLIRMLPAVLFLGALSAVRKVCVRLRQGELFDAAVGRGVSDIGSSLLWGAAALVVITPNLLAMVRGDYGGLGLDVEIESIVIGVVGAVMMLLGRVLGRAARIHDELQSYV